MLCFPVELFRYRLTGSSKFTTTTAEVEEVEQVLHSHPAIDEAAIIGVPDADWGERVRAVVVIKSGLSVAEDDVIEFCRHGPTVTVTAAVLTLPATSSASTVIT